MDTIVTEYLTKNQREIFTTIHVSFSEGEESLIIVSKIDDNRKRKAKYEILNSSTNRITVMGEYQV